MKKKVFLVLFFVGVSFFGFAQDKLISKPITSGKKIYSLQQPPEFPGGDSAMRAFILNNKKTPPELVSQNISGRVLLQFLVSSSGKLDSIRVAKGLHPLADAEAVRIIKAMPNWEPAITNHQPTKSWFTLAIFFNEENKNKPKK